jgi:polar amino acid transport system substrate-binding protein
MGKGTWRKGIIITGVLIGFVFSILVPMHSIASEVDPMAIVKGSQLTKIRERGILRVGCDASYPPFDIVDKQGQIIGFDIDVGNLIAEAIGVKYEVVNTAWEGIFPALQTGKFDMIINGVTITVKRGLAVDLTQPYVTIGQALGINRQRKPDVKDWRELNEKGTIIAVMLGNAGDFLATKLYKNAEIRRFQTAPEMVMEVVAGRADAWQWDIPATAFHVGRNQDRVYIVEVPKTEHREHLGFAIRKGDVVFLNWLNLFITDLRESGKLDELYKKWFVDSEWWVKLLPERK